MGEPLPLTDAATDEPRRPPPHPFDRILDGWEYVLPFAVFLLLTLAGAEFKHYYPHSYAAKTLVVAGLLWWLWPRFTRIRWTHLRLGALVGVVGVVQWVGMEKLLMSQDWLWWTRMVVDVRGESFRPDRYFADSPALYWGFIAVRWLGPTLVVPVMEELFWRDYLWRSLAAPADFRMVRVGEYDRAAVFGIPLLFAAVHVQWLTAIVWGLLIAWLLLKTRSLGSVIVAHGVTNFLLGGWVLFAHYRLGWDEWYFW